MEKILLALFLLSTFGVRAQTIDESDTLIFDLSGASCNGNYFEIPVSFKSDDTIYAIDFSMQYNEPKIIYNAVINHMPAVSPSAYYNLSDSTLRFTSFSMAAIPHDTPVVSLQFNAQTFPVTEADFKNIIAYLNGDVCSYKFIPPSPPVVIIPMGSLTIAPGDSVGLTAPAGIGFTYLWSTTDTTQTIYVTTAGTYEVTVITAGGCSFTDSVTIMMSAPLPVELINFSTMQKGNDALIEWTTASEINNDFFEVQRSHDNIHWLDLIMTEGAGNSSSILYYAETDKSPIPGTSYYRLKQVDFDGTSSYSEVVGLYFDLQKNENNSLTVFPNPANNVLNFFSTENVTVELRDISGREVLLQRTVTGNYMQQADVQQIPSGIYSLRVYEENDGITVKDIQVLIFH